MSSFKRLGVLEVALLSHLGHLWRQLVDLVTGKGAYRQRHHERVRPGSFSAMNFFPRVSN